MLVRVYRCIRVGNSSVIRGALVKEVETEARPTNEAKFASRHGGDFIEVEEEQEVCEA
jgi:hypothetical protein